MEQSSCEQWAKQAMSKQRPSALTESLKVQLANDPADKQVESSAITSTSPVSQIFQHITSMFKQPKQPIQIICRPCSNTGREAHARAFVQSPPLGIVLCTNKMSTKDEIEQTVTHELVHVYDIEKKVSVLTFAESPKIDILCCKLRTLVAGVKGANTRRHDVAQKLDLSKCDNLAYSEVRAAREAECAHGSFLNLCMNNYHENKNDSGILGRIAQSEQCEKYRKDCVKMHAMRSTGVCFPGEAKQCVDRVFHMAYSDNAPFDQTSTQK